MDQIILTTRPKYDDCTEYLAYYASLILKKAEKRNIKTKDFHGQKANRAEILKFLNKKSPKIVFINGHGNANELTGHNGKTLFSENSKDFKLLKDKIIYARACDAGLSFGRKVVKGNDGCFLGYKTNFAFWTDGKRSATPSKDKTAALFLEPSNELMNSLIKGDSTEVAHNKSKKKMIENMNKILKMNKRKEPGAMNLFQYLWGNFEGQVLHGNSSLSF